MVDIKEVAEKTYRMQANVEKTLMTCTVYLIHDEEGIVIEPGPAAIIPLIQEGMKKLGMKTLSHIILTHIHMDHAGATGGLAKLFSRAKVIIHPDSKKHLIDPSRLIDSSEKVFGDNFQDLYGFILPVPESQVETPEDGESISINGRELRVIYTPGHSTDHIALFDSRTKGLFCGEALGLRTKSAPAYPLPNAAPPGFDMEVYLKTSKKLLELGSQILFYAHDGVGRNPEELISNMMENTIMFGDVILKALRAGEKAKSIDHKIRQYISTRHNVKREEADTRIIVEGFIAYFRKRGLV